MKKKIGEYLSVFLKEEENSFVEYNFHDYMAWFIRKAYIKEGENTLVDVCSAYLFAIYYTDKKDHQNLQNALDRIEISEEDRCVIQTMHALVDTIDAEETKEIESSAQRGVDSLLYFLYGRKADVQKDTLNFVRGVNNNCSNLCCFMVLVLRLLISIVQNNFPFKMVVGRENDREQTKTLDKKLSPHIAAVIARSLRREQKYAQALPYAKFSLRLTDPADAMEEFNNYGFCALYLNNYQLAYDIYYSWINKEMVGLLADVPKSFGDREDQWRGRNEDSQAVMRGNMAYTCCAMYHMLPEEDPVAKRLKLAAQKHIKMAYTFEPNQEVLLKTYAEVCYDMGEYKSAVKWLKRSRQYETSQIGKLTAMQRIISIQLELFCMNNHWKEVFLEGNILKNQNGIQNILKEIKKYLSEYSELQSVSHSDTLSRLPHGSFWSEIWQIGENLKFHSEDSNQSVNEVVTCLLLCIYNIAQLIRQQLCCKDYIKKVFYLRDKDDVVEESYIEEVNQIAYYTSMDNLQFLLRKVYCDSKCDRPVSLTEYEKTDGVSDEEIKQAQRNAKNCFTMMHAYYMNDPNEGLTLLNELAEESIESGAVPNVVFHKLPPVVFREQLYDGQFVFLKSFTNVIDQLNMWSMYASDRSEGSDSNGCCICIAPETFHMMMETQSGTEQLAQRKLEDKDDYQLYKVAYVHNGEITEDDEKLKMYYHKLKELFEVLNEVLFKKRLKSNADMEAIQSNLQQSLAPIVFLFKDASYRAEQERRIVVTRKKTALDKISKTSQNPPKLFINPYHQVYVEQLILGPKAKNPDHWIPYLQYELTKMWESWPKSQYGERRPVVRKSSIHYRD